MVEYKERVLTLREHSIATFPCPGCGRLAGIRHAGPVATDKRTREYHCKDSGGSGGGCGLRFLTEERVVGEIVFYE